MTIGKRLEALREAKGLKKTQVAEELRMPYTTYVNYEKDAREPNAITLKVLAAYYDVTIDFLLGIETAEIKKPATDNGDGLTEKEKLMLRLFNLIPPESQGLVLDLIEAALKNQGLL